MEEKRTRVFLVRHGETEWNAARIFQGHLDSQLTRVGIEQARRLSLRLADEEVAAVYSSDQGRAMRTAEVVASRLGLPVVPRADLREIDCGDWTGKTYDEVRELWPDDHENWRDRPHEHCMPNGESVAQVLERGLRYLREVGDCHPGQSVLAVTHNTVVRTIVCHLYGWPLERLWQGPKQANCAVNLLEVDGEKVHLVEAGVVQHLEGLELSTISFQQSPGGAV